MPAGVPWSTYLPFFGAAMLSMMAGAQTVHNFYKPMQDIELYIEAEKKSHNKS